jgi:hypothetical protein
MTAATTATSRERALLFRLTKSQQYSLPHRREEIIFTVITHDDGKQIRGCSGHGETDRKGSIDEDDLRDLRISCSLATDLDSKSYGWDVAYHQPYSVDLRAAERILKTLKLIEQRLARLEKLFGRPSDFGQYVARVAQALDCRAVAFEASETHSSLYRDNDYRFRPIGEAVGRINHEIHTWHEAHPSTRQKYEEEALTAAG